ncbi:hypothetical protein [Clostridium cylindrosporum]|uniref:GIY-YIG domain-containing protein n=1 Tax=Clostridium cylindrosporum DSM 605 TaxID=1121307 RepID=A0A0J8D660_CLOCY|nr:hypothetical protein [Clostridium cylindrosporum]KMT21580.1 hypothetical protein CLCY_2c03420 [Clostridium cylindrosporum DSM 605]
MFGTVIIDAYKKDEANEIAYALEDLCSPNDYYGWASAGVYCFWDYYTKEVLYIGLAVDLCERFKQHNGIIKVDDNSCKLKQIEKYFSNKEKLGYSIFVQSVLSQPIVHRNERSYRKILGENFSREDYVGQLGQQHIKEVEGILIESYRKVNGSYPKWNIIGGSLDGQSVATIGNYSIIKAFNDFGLNPIVSRCTLRELSQNPTYERYENDLHAVRMMVLNTGISFDKAFKFYSKADILNTYGEMINVNYFEKKLVL